MDERKRKALKAFLITTLLGPLAGALAVVLFLLATISFGHEPQPFIQTVIEVAKLVLLTLFIAYMVGGLPAILAGILLAWRLLRNGTIGLPMLFLIAFVSGFVGTALPDLAMITLAKGRPPLTILLERSVLFGCYSLFAAAVLWPLLFHIGILRRDARQET
jgi:hypothetical protein